MNFTLPQQPSKRPLWGEGPRGKKPRPADDFLDLPTHLPNCDPSDNADNATIYAPTLSSEEAVVKVEPLKEVDTETETGERAVVNSKEPIFIEGTNITLQTEEDIAAWIAERKKNWPTRQNVERKMARKAEEPSVKKSSKTGETKQSICKFFAKNNRCKFGSKCKNLHESKNSSITTINGIEVSVPKRYKDSAERGSFFTRLVQRDLYANENDFILTFLQYLHSKHIIDMDGDYS